MQKAYVISIKDCLHDKLFANANDVNERNSLLGISNKSGIFVFKNMHLSTIKRLIALDGGIKLSFKAAYAPKQSVFVQFIEKHSEFKASGFITSADRQDVGVYIDSIEGNVKCNDNTLIAEFKNTFADASGIIESLLTDDSLKLYCWYD